MSSSTCKLGRDLESQSTCFSILARASLRRGRPDNPSVRDRESDCEWIDGHASSPLVTDRTPSSYHSIFLVKQINFPVLCSA